MIPSEPCAEPSPLPPQDFRLRTQERAVATLISAIGLTLLGNFLLWPAVPGLSWGLFLISTGAILALNRTHNAWSRTSAVLFGLLFVTACQSAVEISFSNVFVSLVILVALVGETSYPTLASGWERGSEALWALAKAPGRWGWAGGTIIGMARNKTGVMATVMRCIRIGLPGLLLGGIFASLFSKGNAIFGTLVSAIHAAFWQSLAEFDLSFGHWLFMGVLATFSLWVLRPGGAAGSKRIWARTIPKLSITDASMAWWHSVVILVVLNGLFFIVNTIDVFYLWMHGQLPTGLTASQYVHEGVHSLIAAVILSALILAAIFQQPEEIGKSPLLMRLGYAWIGQNFILIAGVMLRLIRYIQVSLLTLQRVYVFCFLLLVATGFVLLILHIARQRGLNWLILSNGLAAFALFFVMQFLNVAGWVAHYNVAHWELDRSRSLDINYLADLGAPAWPALARAANSKREGAREVRDLLERTRIEDQQAAERDNWRSWQARRALTAARVFPPQP